MPEGNTYTRPNRHAKWVKQNYSCAYVRNDKENFNEIFCNNGDRWRGSAGKIMQYIAPQPRTVLVPGGGGSGRLSDLEDRIDELESRVDSLE